MFCAATKAGVRVRPFLANRMLGSGGWDGTGLALLRRGVEHSAGESRVATTAAKPKGEEGMKPSIINVTSEPRCVLMKLLFGAGSTTSRVSEYGRFGLG